MVYFYDSYAIIEMLENNPKYLKFSEDIITTSTINLFEVYYYLLKKYNKPTADYWSRILDLIFLEITPKISIEASKFKFRYKKDKLSLVDCIGYVLAIRNNLKFLTGDKKFKNKLNVEFVE
jgi:predicted nucleic acid-binding protein